LSEEQKGARKRPFSFLAVELLSFSFSPNVLKQSDIENRCYKSCGLQTDHKRQLMLAGRHECITSIFALCGGGDIVFADRCALVQYQGVAIR
jgi:hypothetical protein